MACVFAHAKDHQLGLQGFAFQPKNLEIIWEAPTNQLPEKLWTYKVASQVFSPAVVSNAMAIGGFTEKDLRRFRVREYPYNHREMRRYTDAEETSYLVIFPPHGWLEYYTSEAIAIGRTPVEGVPSEDEVQKQALEILAALGINKSELATKPGTNELRSYRLVETSTRYPRDGREPEKRTTARGLKLVRKIGDFDIHGTGSTGGFTILFGNNAKIASMSLVWRNLIKDREVKTVTPSDIIARIKQGDFVALDSPKLLYGEGKLKINQLTIKYSGADQDERQTVSRPFARLICNWETTKTNIIIGLEGPILSEK